jgi:CMP/dCMP kinase
MIVTIDGPAGSGKSTIARRLAAVLKTAYLDTGAMYRAIALQVIRAGADWNDHERLKRLAEESQLEIVCGAEGVRVWLDGEDVTDDLRTMEVNQAAAHVARALGVREVLIRQQRRIAGELGSLVTEGRDQGSAVFPNADVKFFLDATPEVRANRRLEEMRQEGQDVSYDDVLGNLIQRDNGDASRWAPIMGPGGAIRIDTTHMSIDQVVQRMAQEIERLKYIRQQIPSQP